MSSSLFSNILFWIINFVAILLNDHNKFCKSVHLIYVLIYCIWWEFIKIIRNVPLNAILILTCLLNTSVASYPLKRAQVAGATDLAIMGRFWSYLGPMAYNHLYAMTWKRKNRTKIDNNKQTPTVAASMQNKWQYRAMGYSPIQGIFNLNSREFLIAIRTGAIPILIFTCSSYVFVYCDMYLSIRPHADHGFEIPDKYSLPSSDRWIPSLW